MIELLASEIHVWKIPLTVSDCDAERLGQLLTQDEMSRAARFVFEKDRRAFTVCRGWLRTLLERYSGVSAKALCFDYSAKGKPRLSLDTDLRFNVSHSGELALFGFTRGCELGIDVERIRPMDDIGNIAKRFFCTEECEELMALSPDEQPDAFFRCWTRKEAFIKATGEGLAAALDQFQVEFRKGHEARFVHINHDVSEAAGWSLHDLAPEIQYAGAVAYRGAARDLQIKVSGPL